MSFDFVTWKKEMKSKIDAGIKLEEQEISDLIEGEIDRIDGNDNPSNKRF